MADYIRWDQSVPSATDFTMILLPATPPAMVKTALFGGQLGQVGTHKNGINAKEYEIK